MYVYLYNLKIHNLLWWVQNHSLGHLLLLRPFQELDDTVQNTKNTFWWYILFFHSKYCKFITQKILINKMEEMLLLLVFLSILWRGILCLQIGYPISFMSTQITSYFFSYVILLIWVKDLTKNTGFIINQLNYYKILLYTLMDNLVVSEDPFSDSLI